MRYKNKLIIRQSGLRVAHYDGTEGKLSLLYEGDESLTKIRLDEGEAEEVMHAIWREIKGAINDES